MEKDMPSLIGGVHRQDELPRSTLQCKNAKTGHFMVIFADDISTVQTTGLVGRTLIIMTNGMAFEIEAGFDEVMKCLGYARVQEKNN